MQACSRTRTARSWTSLPGDDRTATNRHAFYTYEAKYLDQDGALLKVPADLPKEIVRRVQDISLQAFRALGCEAHGAGSMSSCGQT